MTDPTDRPDPLFGWDDTGPLTGPTDALGRPQDARGPASSSAAPSRPATGSPRPPTGGHRGAPDLRNAHVWQPRPIPRSEAPRAGRDRRTTTSSIAGEDTRPPRRGRWQALVALGVLLTIGGLGAVSTAVIGLVTSTSAVIDGDPVPAWGLLIDLDEGDRRTLWAPEGVHPECRVLDPRDEFLPVEPRNVDISAGGESLSSIGAFTASTTGAHYVACMRDDVRISEADPRVFPEVLGAFGGVFSLILGASGITAGMAGLRRGSARSVHRSGPVLS